VNRTAKSISIDWGTRRLSASGRSASSFGPLLQRPLGRWPPSPSHLPPRRRVLSRPGSRPHNGLIAGQLGEDGQVDMEPDPSARGLALAGRAAPTLTFRARGPTPANVHSPCLHVGRRWSPRFTPGVSRRGMSGRESRSSHVYPARRTRALSSSAVILALGQRGAPATPLPGPWGASCATPRGS
jgi:hypothetical protein